MSLLALGLNHHTAPVDIRERASISENQLEDALCALKKVDAVNEATIISTCNRTEIYCGMRTQDAQPVLQWMHHYLDINPDVFEPHMFQHANQAVVRHLMRVCSGLDSLVLGEPQILGQIKQAYRNANDVGAIGSELSPLFQRAFSVAKQVRTDTAIGSSPVSVAFAAASLAKQIFDDFSKHKALMVGAGDTIQLASRHLHASGIGQLTIANRTLSRASHLAEELNGHAIPLKDIPNVLAEADIIICSTGAELPILGKGAMESAMRKRRFKPVLIVDIAVPRDVEHEVGDIDGVFLYTVDDLHSVIDEGRQNRKEAAQQAEDIITHEVELFMQRLRALGATDTIRAYRESINDTREDAVAKSLQKLKSGQDPEQVLNQLAHALSNKIMHTPSKRLREAAQAGDTQLLNAAKTLFDLDIPKS